MSGPADGIDMPHPTSPQDVYRRIEFDARVNGAGPAQLVDICYDQLIAALGTALFAESRENNELKSQSLTRALSAITALQRGIDLEQPMGKALAQIYGAARGAILDSVVAFNATTLGAVRQDVIDIQSAFRSS